MFKERKIIKQLFVHFVNPKTIDGYAQQITILELGKALANTSQDEENVLRQIDFKRQSNKL